MTISTLVPQVDQSGPRHTTISADGHYIVFANSYALEQPDPVALGTVDVFRVDTQTGQLQIVSGPHGPDLSAGDMPTISDDGMRVAYRSWVYHVDGTGQSGVAVKDLATGATVQLADSAHVYYDSLSMSADARLVAYTARLGQLYLSPKSVVVQDVQTKQVVYQQDNLDHIHQVQLSGDGKSLLVGDDGLRIVHLADGTSQVIADAHDDDGHTAASISADGRYRPSGV